MESYRRLDNGDALAVIYPNRTCRIIILVGVKRKWNLGRYLVCHHTRVHKLAQRRELVVARILASWFVTLDHVHPVGTWAPPYLASVVRKRPRVDVLIQTMRVDGFVEISVEIFSLVESIPASEVVMKGYVEAAKYCSIQSAIVVESKGRFLAPSETMRRKVTWMMVHGLDRSIAALSAGGHLIVAFLSISASLGVTFRT